MLALAHACFVDPEDAFTALAFELQLLHQPAKLPIQGLEIVFGLNSAVTASHVSYFGVISLLLLLAKYFFALAADYGVFWEVSTECTDELFYLLFVQGISFVKSHFQHSSFSQLRHTSFYLQRM